MITLYGQHNCGLCKAVEMQLLRKKVDFTKVSITEENLSAIQSKGITEVPTIELDNGKLLIKKQALEWVNSIGGW